MQLLIRKREETGGEREDEEELILGRGKRVPAHLRRVVGTGTLPVKGGR